MADAITLTAADLSRIVPQDDLRRGAELFDKQALAHLARFQNKLFAEAKGSDPTPYKVNIEVAATLAEMKIRCACWASRSRPICKHAAAVLVAWARAPESFAVSDAPPSGGVAGGVPPRSGASGETAKKKSVKKGKTDAKDVMGQGVAQVATLVRELATAGVSSLSSDRAAQVRALGTGLREQGLRRLSARTIDLAALLDRASDPAGFHPAPYVELLADMLLTARKLEKHVGGEPLDDRYVEELVGKTWGKNDRKPIEGLSLVEYAYVHYATADGFEVNESRFIDLTSGAHYTEKQIIPKFLSSRTEEKASHGGYVLRGARGGVYPGFAPLRLSIDDAGQKDELFETSLSELREKTLPDIAAALAAFQEHRKDIFAPGRFPVAVRADALVVTGGRLRIVDAAGNALHLPDGSSIGDTIGAAKLVAVLGDIDVDAAFPTLYPLAVLLDGKRGLDLRSVSSRSEPTRRARADAAERRLEAGAAWAEAAREAGASGAAIALHEVRDELAQIVASGLAGLSARAVEPLCARMKELSLEKPAALLASVPARPEGERVDDIVKVFQVLGVALVRIAGAARVDRSRMVAVPGARSVLVRDPEAPLAPSEALRRLSEGTLHAFEAAVHFTRYFERAPANELLSNITAAWANGVAGEHVARSLAGLGADAVHAAEEVLAGPYGRTAHVTAIRVLDAVGTPEAITQLKLRSADERDERLTQRLFAREALDARGLGDPSRVPGSDEKARVAGLVRHLESAAKSDDRRLAARMLPSCGLGALRALRRAHQEDGSRDVRHEAGRGLALLCDAASVPGFVSALAARGDHDDEAKAAAYALGEIGDTRGAPELVAAFAEGWKPAVIAEAIGRLGLVAIDPLLEGMARHPDLGARKALETIVDALPEAEVSSFLVDRAIRARGTKDVGERAGALLKLAGSRKPVRQAVARAVVELLPEPEGAEQKAAVRSAARMLKAK